MTDSNVPVCSQNAAQIGKQLLICFLRRCWRRCGYNYFLFSTNWAFWFGDIRENWCIHYSSMLRATHSISLTNVVFITILRLTLFFWITIFFGTNSIFTAIELKYHCCATRLFFTCNAVSGTVIEMQMSSNKWHAFWGRLFAGPLILAFIHYKTPYASQRK
jgi:hypothetical protein